MRSLSLAVGMFTVLPAPVVDADRRTAAAAVRWLPLVGAVLGALAGGLALAVWRGGPAGSPLLGATVAVLGVALLTRGLHLDGLADLADGLGSRAPGPRALEIMRQSDVGPFGVAAALGALLLQVAALAEVFSATGRAAGVVVTAAVAAVSRVAVLDAAAPGVRPARPGGFGALVAGSARPLLSATVATGVLVAAWASLLPSTSAAAALWLPAAGLAGLAAARALRAHAVRRLGGVTGDVFGALVEVAATVTLLGLAVVVTWRGTL